MIAKTTGSLKASLPKPGLPHRKDPMHIVLFHDSVLPPPNYGGIERIVVTLAEEYSRRGHKVSVLCRKGSKLSGSQVIEIPENFAEAYGNDIEKIIPADVDFVHSHQPLSVEPKRP